MKKPTRRLTVRRENIRALAVLELKAVGGDGRVAAGGGESGAEMCNGAYQPKLGG